MMPIIVQTERLLIRGFTPNDAGFMLRLLNEPSFIENIGDRGVRTEEEAAAYLASGPIASYATYGHGLCRVELRETGEPIGMCGLLRREQFDDPDVGYAFLPEFWGRGFALESVAAMVEDGRRRLRLTRIIAIVAPHNTASSRLLEKLGFTFEETTQFQPDGSEVQVYASS
ncbi:MAG TPA: GNAT family N-acetyltransferase [Longimicrobium sp.]|jgi:RimJ/RimL family protein N-acetyltransferase